ncbi:MADS-box transcription factor 8-like [Miscanthus floridulus]|uniref:MADS-box transcription factor 8-like n=1 Tax=Miscanthus floridulus TaxID=154761 RepID=UPI00345ABB53
MQPRLEDAMEEVEAEAVPKAMAGLELGELFVKNISFMFGKQIGSCRALPPHEINFVPLKQLVQSSRNEYLKLKTRVNNLQRTQRNLLGEDLGSLGIKELEQFEKQLDLSLRHIRSTGTQHMLDQLTDLQRREQMLCEANKCLRRTILGEASV